VLLRQRQPQQPVQEARHILAHLRHARQAGKMAVTAINVTFMPQCAS
jgi:hypothetical protein